MASTDLLGPARDGARVDSLGEPPPPVAPRPSVGRWFAAMTGVVAAGAALAAGELATAVAGSGPSLVTAVGSEFIDRFAASLKALAVELFGTNDKIALVAGIVITSLLLGAALGVKARRRWIVAPLGFAGFGVLGGLALSNDPQGSTETAIVAAIAAVAVGIGAFAALWLLALRQRSGTPTQAPTRTAAARTRTTMLDRRGFVLGVGGLAVGSLAAAALARRVRSVSGVDAARRSTLVPKPGRSTPPPDGQPFEDVPGLTPYVTSNVDFYRIDTALLVPQVNPDGWELSVKGLVDRPFQIGYAELLALDSVADTITIQCVSNEVGGDLVGNAVWQGVPLAALLDRAGVQQRATQIVGRSIDGFTAGFPTADALDGRNALVAYAMNGEPLPAAHGFPARLIIAGLYGYVSATKWLTEIELTTWEDFDGYWVPRGWSKEGPIKIASRIDVPRSGSSLPAGPQSIAGVAWAPTRGIDRVEVQIDDGPWQRCELGRTASGDTWVQWRLVWDAVPGEHTVRVRATDGQGELQTDELAPPAPDGASGWHTVTFDVSS